jgi:hypothetical protein
MTNNMMLRKCVLVTLYIGMIYSFKHSSEKKTEKKNLDERFRWISLLSFKEIYKKKKFNMFEKFFFVTRVNS